jgi:hypothetical protein
MCETSRTFDPWVGSRYASEGIRGVRLLILGESHHCETGPEYPAFTADIVRRLGQGQQKPFRFFTVTQRLVTGGRGSLSKASREDFWERVAFYNFVQSFLPKSRRKPTEAMWLAAREPLLRTLTDLAPEAVLILGDRLSRNLPKLPPNIESRAVPHPASSKLRYAEWQPVVQKMLDVAGARSFGSPTAEPEKSTTS